MSVVKSFIVNGTTQYTFDHAIFEIQSISSEYDKNGVATKKVQISITQNLSDGYFRRLRTVELPSAAIDEIIIGIDKINETALTAALQGFGLTVV